MEHARQGAPVRRVASVIGLAEEHAEQYLLHHRAVWPEVLDALSRAHVTNYSIYRHGDLLFSYFEYRGTDFEADMARIAADEATQRWWSIMMPMQRTLRTGPEDPWWTDLEEVFHLE
ncbi:MAG TPA: L-rhamnose mutarotase [Acidimicrobiales bacterium]|nr:L-rhamnose mutarotase [Acidimicrobiales bacterium]